MVLLELGHGGAHAVGDLRARWSPAPRKCRHRHRVLVVQQRAQRVVGRAQFQPRDVAQPGHGAVGAGLDDDVAELFLALQPALGVDRQLQVHARAGRAKRRPRRRPPARSARGWRAPRRWPTGRAAPPSADRARPASNSRRAPNSCTSPTPCDARQPVLDVEQRVVAQVGHVVAVVGRQQVHHHREVGRALDGGHAQAPHFLGQARLGLRHAVLHQLLRLVGVGAELEGDVQRHQAVGGGLAAHVEHAFHAVDRFLQRRGHGFGDHLGIGARDSSRAPRRRAAPPPGIPRSAARAARSGRPGRSAATARRRRSAGR